MIFYFVHNSLPSVNLHTTEGLDTWDHIEAIKTFYLYYPGYRLQCISAKNPVEGAKVYDALQHMMKNRDNITTLERALANS